MEAQSEDSFVFVFLDMVAEIDLREKWFCISMMIDIEDSSVWDVDWNPSTELCESKTSFDCPYNKGIIEDIFVFEKGYLIDIFQF